MICYTQHKDIDKKKWDACVEHAQYQCVYAYSWYLDAACKNWSALILNDYEAVFPLATRSKYGIHYIFQPFFTRYFGVLSKESVSAQTGDLFLKAIPQKFKLLEFSLHESNALEPKDITLVSKRYQFLNLNFAYEHIYKLYSENTKRNLKKAIKANFTITNTVTEQEIVSLFRKTKGEELKTFKDKDYTTLVTLMKTISVHKKSEMIGVLDVNKQLVAAGFFIKNKNQLIYLKGGVADTGRANGAMHFLFDNLIKEHASSAKTLDFGGSSVESVARFYKSFGAKDCVYLQLKKNSLSRLAKWISRKS